MKETPSKVGGLNSQNSSYFSLFSKETARLTEIVAQSPPMEGAVNSLIRCGKIVGQGTFVGTKSEVIFDVVLFERGGDFGI